MLVQDSRGCSVVAVKSIVVPMNASSSPRRHHHLLVVSKKIKYMLNEDLT